MRHSILTLLATILVIATNAQPNVILVVTDDLGYGDLGSYGHQFIETPNIDQLAREGIRFDHYYAASPLCSPSRAGMLTGRTPYRTGIKSWIPEDDNIFLTSKEVTIASLLKQRGYRTFFAGKWHLNGGLLNKEHPQPHAHGFDYWFGTHNFTLPTHKDPNNFFRNGEALGSLTGFAGQLVVDEAIGWLDTLSHQHPFFMYISFHEPHSEIASPDSFNSQYQEFTSKPIDLDHLENRGPGEYFANVSHMDYQVGRLLDAIDANGFTDDTIIIFTSDNGPVTNQWRYWWEVNMYGSTGGLRGRKADLFEGGIRVPLIVKYPELIEPGSQSKIPLIGYDLLPTICSITKTDLPKDRMLDGIDFSPLFSNQTIDRKSPLFWAFETRKFDDPSGYLYAVRQGPWKMIIDEDLEHPLLYNLDQDPYEVIELSNKHPEIISELKSFVSKMIVSIDQDPIRPVHDPQSRE